MAVKPIDRDKLRVFMRTQDTEAQQMFLDRAIDLLPKTKLAKLVEGFADPRQLRTDTASPTELLDAVKRFHAASLDGDYYEDFMVDSRNFMSMSQGTEAWIAECHRLLDSCVAASKRAGRGGQVETRGAFDLLFDLLRKIDECNDDIIFFADEAGAWQVGVEWDVVLPAWFRCLGATASPDEYAAAVQGAIDEFASYRAVPLLEAAHRAATPEQREALAP